MDKDIVIKIRDTLKQGINLPLLVLVDNAFMNVDESDTSRFTKWDDENGILYQWMLPVPHMQKSYKEKTVCLYALSYEYIQGMQCNCLPVDKIDSCIEAIKASGCNVSDDFKKRIITVYEKLTDPNDVMAGPTDFNNLVSSHRLDPNVGSAVNEVNDYYSGKFREPIRITKPTRDYNESIKDEIEAKQNARTNDKLMLDEDIKTDSETNIVTGRKYTEI